MKIFSNTLKADLSALSGRIAVAATTFRAGSRGMDVKSAAHARDAAEVLDIVKSELDAIISSSTVATETPIVEKPEPDKIVELLERIAKAEGYKAGAWARVISEAKQYALMKSFGKYIETSTGFFITVSHNDRENMARMFADNTLRYAIDALAEDSIGS